jgi:hypothetical protein
MLREIPSELWATVFHYTDLHSLLRLSQVSDWLHKLVNPKQLLLDWSFSYSDTQLIFSPCDKIFRTNYAIHQFKLGDKMPREADVAFINYWTRCYNSCDNFFDSGLQCLKPSLKPLYWNRCRYGGLKSFQHQVFPAMVEAADFYLYLFFEVVCHDGRTYVYNVSQEGPLSFITQHQQHRRIQILLDSNISFHIRDNGLGFLQCHVLDKIKPSLQQMIRCMPKPTVIYWHDI